MLTDADLAILAFERQWFRMPGAKEQAIVTEIGMRTTRYFQHLNRLLDSPEALAHDPQTVRRLQRLRAERHKQKAG